MDENTAIILYDSDEEPEPKSKHNTSKKVIYIDLSDDETPCDPIPYTSNKNSSIKDMKDPLTAELEYILQAPLPSLQTNNKNSTQKRISSSNRNQYLSSTKTINPPQALRISKDFKELSPPIYQPISSFKLDQSMHRVSWETPSSCDISSIQSSSRRQKKPMDSPFNRRPELKRQKVSNSRQKELQLEYELEQFVTAVSSTRFKPQTHKERAPCPICGGYFFISHLNSHTAFCSTVKITRKKKTIAEAVAIDEYERKRRNCGIEETEPTNYYKVSADEVFATDGVGFNESASGPTWEYAGQTHFG